MFLNLNITSENEFILRVNDFVIVFKGELHVVLCGILTLNIKNFIFNLNITTQFLV